MSKENRLRLVIEGAEKQQGDSSHSINIQIPRFTLYQGEIVGVTGANGSGKSTMLDMIGMLVRPNSITKFLFFTDDGREIDLFRINSRQTANIRRQHLAYILQSGGLLEFLTIKQNISLVKRLKGGRQVRMDEITEALSIGDILHKKPGRLSGGQRQKGAIARALVQEPDIILADEPTSAMDSVSAKRLIQIFTNRAKKSGTSLILVSHDRELIQLCADRTYRFQVVDEGGGRLKSTLYEEKDGT